MIPISFEEGSTIPNFSGKNWDGIIQKVSKHTLLSANPSTTFNINYLDH